MGSGPVCLALTGTGRGRVERRERCNLFGSISDKKTVENRKGEKRCA